MIVRCKFSCHSGDIPHKSSRRANGYFPTAHARLSALGPITNNALQLQPARRHKESVIVGVTAQKDFSEILLPTRLNYDDDDDKLSK